MKIKPIYIVNFLFIIIVIALLFSPLRKVLEKMQSTNAQSQFSTIDKLSDQQYSIDLKGVNAQDVNFKEFKGKKIFLNYWGTWCPVCVEEMPEIQKLYEKKKNEIQFVLIYMKDDRALVEQYLRKNNYSFPVYEAVSPIDAALLARAFPTTFLIDEKGNVKEKIEGARDWAQLNF
ncbi:TlpA disulfide reductase family protein [Apibacter raozihei]|uniref:TlpA family protein disulfide reductase n=1 Tax=Apibacter raozihei TaxID=2500547 RepID=UPI000FE35C44|nr:TlpA disulfide reductase family protein [Apibacter raozihei]